LDDREDGGGGEAGGAGGADGGCGGDEAVGGTGDVLAGELAGVAGVGGVRGVPDRALEGRAGACYVGCYWHRELVWEIVRYGTAAGVRTSCGAVGLAGLDDGDFDDYFDTDDDWCGGTGVCSQ
jgi:hypothetical protein